MPALRFLSHGLTHVGLVRQRNEDAFLERPERGLWAVADGMGGHQAGDFASTRIVEALAAITPQPGLTACIDEVRFCLGRVDTELRDRAARLGSYAVIASTVVVLLARSSEIAALWAGDSRLYRWRDGDFRQVTVDHSRVQELVAAGLLRREDAAGHPESNIVTRAVGAGPPVDLAVIRDGLKPGDRFLLCSDGLTNMLSDAEIAAELAAAAPQSAAERLLSRVLARGAIDNVTIVIVGSETGA